MDRSSLPHDVTLPAAPAATWSAEADPSPSCESHQGLGQQRYSVDRDSREVAEQQCEEGEDWARARAWPSAPPASNSRGRLSLSSTSASAVVASTLQLTSIAPSPQEQAQEQAQACEGVPQSSRSSHHFPVVKDVAVRNVGALAAACLVLVALDIIVSPAVSGNYFTQCSTSPRAVPKVALFYALSGLFTGVVFGISLAWTGRKLVVGAVVYNLAVFGVDSSFAALASASGLSEDNISILNFGTTLSLQIVGPVLIGGCASLRRVGFFLVERTLMVLMFVPLLLFLPLMPVFARSTGFPIGLALYEMVAVSCVDAVPAVRGNEVPDEALFLVAANLVAYIEAGKLALMFSLRDRGSIVLNLAVSVVCECSLRNGLHKRYWLTLLGWWTGHRVVFKVRNFKKIVGRCKYSFTHLPAFALALQFAIGTPVSAANSSCDGDWHPVLAGLMVEYLAFAVVGEFVADASTYAVWVLLGKAEHLFRRVSLPHWWLRSLLYFGAMCSSLYSFEGVVNRAVLPDSGS